MDRVVVTTCIYYIKIEPQGKPTDVDAMPNKPLGRDFAKPGC